MFLFNQELSNLRAELKHKTFSENVSRLVIIFMPKDFSNQSDSGRFSVITHHTICLTDKRKTREPYDFLLHMILNQVDSAGPYTRRARAAMMQLWTAGV